MRKIIKLPNNPNEFKVEHLEAILILNPTGSIPFPYQGRFWHASINKDAFQGHNVRMNLVKISKVSVSSNQILVECKHGIKNLNNMLTLKLTPCEREYYIKTELRLPHMDFKRNENLNIVTFTNGNPELPDITANLISNWEKVLRDYSLDREGWEIDFRYNLRFSKHVSMLPSFPGVPISYLSCSSSRKATTGGSYQIEILDETNNRQSNSMQITPY